MVFFMQFWAGLIHGLIIVIFVLTILSVRKDRIKQGKKP